jgi:hypothetical protein
MARVECLVGALVALGPAPQGERRCVPLTGGTVRGPELNGRIVEGGVDWQWLRADGMLDIAAHYLVRTDDDALVEVRSEGLRHGPAEVMARLARGEPVSPDEYFFRTLVRFTAGAPQWSHLNKMMAIGCGERRPDRVLIDVWRLL